MRVAIYSRKSIETDKGDSIKNQIEMCKEYFLRREDNISFEIFEDEGFTGANTNRPSFQLMMQKAKNKDFDIVAVYRLDRVSRNVLDFLNFHDTLKKLDIKFVSITENFDTSTSMGQMMLLMISGFAQMERENIAQRVKDNMRSLAQSGKWTGGVVPFGYIAERDTKEIKKATYLKLDPSKKELINEIFEYYIKSQSMHQVQKWLYSEKEIKWCLSTIKNILTSPVYVKTDNQIIDYLKNFGEVYGEPNNKNGTLTYNRRPYTNGKHRWNDNDMFYAISRHEGILDSDVWLNVQFLQNKNKSTPRPKSSQVSYLTGMLKCDKCGSNMTVSYNHKNKDGSITYVYLCTGRKDYGTDYCDCKQVKQTILDESIIDYLANILLLKEDEFSKLVGSNKIDNNIANEIKKIEKKLKTNLTKIDNLTDNLSELTKEEGASLRNKLKLLTEENKNLRTELLLLQQQNLSSKRNPPQQIYNNFKVAVTIIKNPNIDIDTKKAALKSCIEEIRYLRHDPENIELKLAFL